MCRWHWGQILFPWHLRPYLQSLVEIESAWWRYFFVLAVRFEQMKLEPADVSWEVVNELSARVDRCKACGGASEVPTGWRVDCPENHWCCSFPWFPRFYLHTHKTIISSRISSPVAAFPPLDVSHLTVVLTAGCHCHLRRRRNRHFVKTVFRQSCCYLTVAPCRSISLVEPAKPLMMT